MTSRAQNKILFTFNYIFIKVILLNNFFTFKMS